MRKRLAVVLTIFAGLPVSSVLSQSGSAPPRLILVLAIDQMKSDYVTRFEQLYKGGFRTLLDGGAIFTNAHYRHSASETGPGHSVILSGRHPSHSGIVANDWFDPYLGKTVNVVEDPAQRPLGGAGRNASPVNAIGFTIGDVLKASNPQARVVGVSLKDRSAILMAGRRADAAYWYETAGGNFITSTYYMAAAAQWHLDWNARHIADQYSGSMWTRLISDAGVYDRYAGMDPIEGEWDRKDIVFPHAIRSSAPQTAFYDDLRRTPFADEITLDFALEAMEAHHIGEDGVTDILAIGFSATDVIGHTYGADSHELMDQMLRLDLVLQKLFTAVETKVGLANTLIVLTADHGSLPLVENLQAKGIAARRVAPTVLRNAVTEAFEKRFPGVTDLIQSYSAPDFYLNERTIRRHNLQRKDVEDTARTALLNTGVVAQVYTHDDLRSTQPSPDPFLPLFQNAFYEPRSPHLSVLLKEWTYMSGLTGGTGHGTAYGYDRHVPIIFLGTGVKKGSYTLAAGPEDIAPTLGAILGLEFPREPDARLLNEMLTETVPLQ